MKTFTCQYCLKPFETASQWALFCSKNCRQDNSAGREYVDRSQIMCGFDTCFNSLEGTRQGAEFCSRLCKERNKQQKKNSTEVRFFGRGKPDLPILVEFRICDNEECNNLLDLGSHGSKKFCSNRCRAGSEKKQYIRSAKDAPCFDCEETFPWYCMDFDHLPEFNKSFELSKISGRDMFDIKLEIAKCDLVCANCHRIRTYSRW